ncbi:Transcription factor bHLH47-like [Heracleum sosnowskyi]|uniref:Transcription factor bHLH47-like n=1 Tax=Heracleum sosnowskyi TaxID=360622 RepID=A0AAD8H3I1_9APIA|nr:Transcription factor bHLH47-like [Heracleum sosnowskyi]
MARVLNRWSHTKTVLLIWFICTITFYSLLRMALLNASHNSPSDDLTVDIVAKDSRASLYDKMARDLHDKGALFLKQGETSQSLSLSDIFALKDGSVTPMLKAADPPVRANVLHLSPDQSSPISAAVRDIFLPYFNKVIWFQNSSMYHFSMYHASHHIVPVPATEAEIEAEANAVRAVADTVCPLNIVLDRVVLTSTGVVLGCWQVLSGTDPLTIRAKLKTALPRSPAKQLYNNVMLHTSFARLLGRPNTYPQEGDKTSELKFFDELVTRANNRLSGIQATVTELWYVEEYDVLALALNGRMKTRKFQLGCSKA